MLVANWDKVVSSFKEFIPKLKKAWAAARPLVPYAARMYGDIVVEGAERLGAIMHKLFYKEDGQWVEETTTRKVPASEVPADIRELIEVQEADITAKMEEKLELQIA
ncbi:hypothetical protein NZ47_10500 [Anaerovibrio lipolyticus]|uniref:Uncharacterized protein n=1 Tax=Anaerovibrio lipolyticus TaxID=82374 RepID=A0A0B2JXS6_9FIRM|nr:hypothetical protein NZ47_10500 [Anaerovibrio lipolyticus]